MSKEVYVAMDKDDTVWIYETKPDTHKFCWRTDFGESQNITDLYNLGLFQFDLGTDWTKSLRKIKDGKVVPVVSFKKGQRVLVSATYTNSSWTRRYVADSQLTKLNEIIVYYNGRDEWAASGLIEHWPYWKLPEEG